MNLSGAQGQMSQAWAVEKTRRMKTASFPHGSPLLACGRHPVEVYQVTKLDCCDAGPTYGYFSPKDGTKLRSTENKLNKDELAALDVSVI